MPRGPKGAMRPAAMIVSELKQLIFRDCADEPAQLLQCLQKQPPDYGDGACEKRQNCAE